MVWQATLTLATENKNKTMSCDAIGNPTTEELVRQYGDVLQQYDSDESSFIELGEVQDAADDANAGVITQDEFEAVECAWSRSVNIDDVQETLNTSNISNVTIDNIEAVGDSVVEITFSITNNIRQGNGETLDVPIELLGEHVSTPATERKTLTVTVEPGVTKTFSTTLDIFRSDTVITLTATDPFDGSEFVLEQRFSFITDAEDDSELDISDTDYNVTTTTNQATVNFTVINQILGGSGETLSGTVSIESDGSQVDTVNTGDIPPGESKSFDVTIGFNVDTGQSETKTICANLV